MKKAWWKEAIVYQIYPRSFKDSNGDGIGDLKGIYSKLDYIKSLGVDVVWLNPVYASPNDDNGYDISDYRAIMAEFGTMDDFDQLLEGMHDRGIKLVMDLVVNHSSDEHEWFKQSRTSRENPYRDYYHWWPAEKGKPAPRFSFFDKDGDAWKYDTATDAYYLHYFSEKQPDLNWENPKLRQEIYDMMHFWFKKGIDGFRMDVITFISKDTAFPPMPAQFQPNGWDNFYASGPHLHEYLQEMNREVLSYYNCLTVAEGPGTSVEDVLDMVDEDRHELQMNYHFDHTYMGYLPRKMLSGEPKDLVAFKNVFTKWDKALAEKGWGAIYLGNHDQPRMVTRWGNDSPEWRELSSKMLTTFILTSRGTPYYYQGDEIGMSNIKFDDIADYRDIETTNWYNLIKKEGGDLNEFIQSHKITARDNGRTPIQWDETPNAGFTTGTPWLKVNPNYSTINVKAAESDPNSCLHYFRELVNLRKQNEAFVYGNYTLLEADNPDTYTFTRQLNDEQFLIILNFTAAPAQSNHRINLATAKMLTCNYSTPPTGTTIRPFEALVYQL
jgi:oligo-1,6-glucosidase